MAGLPRPGFEGLVTSLHRRLTTLEQNLGALRAPKQVFSDARPDPSTIRVGTRLFELDTNRSIFVNATQDGFVDTAGTAL